MCSINGFISFKEKISKKSIQKIKDIMIKGGARGRDSFGYAYLDRGEVKEFKSLGNVQKELVDLDIPLTTKIFISNNRAEPTTEYKSSKTPQDVQPYGKNNIFIVHNGTIANDKELDLKYNFIRSNPIDSNVIPYLLDKKWLDGDTKTLIPILRDELIGSYSLAIFNKTIDNKLWLATNYKPLFLLYDRDEEILFFSSLEEFLSDNDYNNLFKNESIMEVKPYTLLEINNKVINKFSLYKEKDNKNSKKKALIIASGGMDSTVCASWAISQGYEIELLHFKYKCRAQNAEERAVTNLSKFFKCKLTFIPCNFFKDSISHSPLFEESGTAEREKGAELAIEWVPARNLIFMSIAAGYAEAHNFDYIVLGGNLEESGAYPDNEYIFQKKFGELLPNALNLQNRVEVLTPVAHLMKHEIVKLGLELGAPLHLTWSCYEDGEIPCGKCGPDYMRRMAFRMNGIEDMQVYKYN